MQGDNQGMLSQNEIDRLLAGSRAPAGEAAAPASVSTANRFQIVRPYDFKRPSMLSKDQLRTIQLVFENCARMASAGFARELRTHVQISLTSVEQSTFEEYVRVLSDKTTPVLNIVSAEPLLGSLVFEYSMELGSVMIDHLLGGTGATGYTERAVTEIEELLLRSMGEIFTAAYGDAWTDLIPITPALQRIEYTPRFLQVASLAAPVLVVIFDVRMDERSYEMSLCLPYAMIESEVGKLNMQALFMAAPGQAESQKVPEQNLVGVRVPLAVELGQAEIPFGAIAGLAVGDLVRLNAHKQDPVLVRVNGLPAFLGRPGLLAGDRVGVQVLTTIKTEEETR